MDISHNYIDSAGLKSIVNSFNNSAAYLYIDASSNSIASLPAHLLTGLAASDTMGGYIGVDLNLAFNPITSIDPQACVANASYLASVQINMSYPTAGHIAAPEAFDFSGISWQDAVVSLSLAATGLDISIIRVLSEATNAPNTYSLDLSFNNYTQIPPGTFVNSKVANLSLAFNSITSLPADTFPYNFVLEELNLQGNRLTAIAPQIAESLAVLKVFQLRDNAIWAIPARGNHISTPDMLAGNVLQCDILGPIVANCTCQSNLVPSTLCGYQRCLPTASGCFPTEINNQSCGVAPYSTCLGHCPPRQWYAENIATCVPVTQCASAFPDPDDPQLFLPAYQVRNASSTSDRLCSVCASCPEGFDTTPCGVTTPTKCTRPVHLSPGDIAALSLGIVLLLAAATVGGVYGWSERGERAKTVQELEMAEHLLADVQDENERLEQAWSIENEDLQYGVVVGEGAFGRVFRGNWG